MKKSISAGQVFLAFALLASRAWAQPGGAPPATTPEPPSPDTAKQDAAKQDAQKQDAPKQDAVKEPPGKPNEKLVEKPDVLATATIDALAKAGCEYVGTGISTVLIRNARGQRVQLRALTQKCNNPDPAFGRRTALQALSDVRVVLKSPDVSQAISATISGGYITIDYVPEGLKDLT